MMKKKRMRKMVCKDICNCFEKEHIKGYDKGQRYCKMCSYYMVTEKLFCQCCNKMYRRSKRYNKSITIAR